MSGTSLSGKFLEPRDLVIVQDLLKFTHLSLFYSHTTRKRQKTFVFLFFWRGTNGTLDQNELNNKKCNGWIFLGLLSLPLYGKLVHATGRCSKPMDDNRLIKKPNLADFGCARLMPRFDIKTVFKSVKLFCQLNIYLVIFVLQLFCMSDMLFLLP